VKESGLHIEAAAGQGDSPMAAGDITFVKCPRGDSFPVRKTSGRSEGHQQIVCPRCGHDFDVTMEETVERLSQPNLALAMAR
jgi:transposase-like protein